MLLVFTGPDFPHDPQVDFVVEEAGKAGFACVVCNPFNVQSSRLILKQSGGEMVLMQGCRRISPRAVYVSARWRADSLISIPRSVKYTGVYRSQVGQFLQDLRFSLESCKWLPGKIEAIERAESKLLMLVTANKLGISIPKFTVNSFSISRNFGNRVYRKKLGFPFVVTYNNRKMLEVGVTTTNTAVDVPVVGIRSKSPWQWQEVVKARSHVRCCIVDKNVWAKVSDYPSRFKAGVDFRNLNQIKDIDLIWKNVQINPRLIKRLLLLNERLGISVSCPEFLIDYEGNWKLIDLNPCGDWFGFFSESENREIARAIARLASPD